MTTTPATTPTTTATDVATGQTVTVELMRDGTPHPVQVVLASRPAA